MSPDPLPGPYGKDWFELTLDITAPSLSFGIATGTSAGEHLIIPYTQDEEGVFSAEIVSPLGEHFPLLDTGTSLEFDLPANWIGGDSRIIITTRDDVYNARLYDFQLSIEGAEVDLGDTGGGHRFTYGPVIGEPQEVEIAAEVELAKQVTFRIAAEVELRRVQPVLYEYEFSGQIALARSVEFSFNGSRSPSAVLCRMNEEDELLLLT